MQHARRLWQAIKHIAIDRVATGMRLEAPRVLEARRVRAGHVHHVDVLSDRVQVTHFLDASATLGQVLADFRSHAQELWADQVELEAAVL